MNPFGRDVLNNAKDLISDFLSDMLVGSFMLFLLKKDYSCTFVLQE
jgi:hypothetical protein